MLWDTAVDFETFQRVLNRPGGFRDPGEPEEYCRGFQVFDKDMTGFIGVGQLKYILTNLGEKMTDEEVDELLKAVDTSSGQVNYTGMLSSPYTTSRLLQRLIQTNTLLRTCANYPRQLRMGRNTKDALAGLLYDMGKGVYCIM